MRSDGQIQKHEIQDVARVGWLQLSCALVEEDALSNSAMVLQSQTNRYFLTLTTVAMNAVAWPEFQTSVKSLRICENALGCFTTSANKRRALLSSPRVSTDGILSRT